MSNNRTHFVTTSDAVTIGATVTGQGPSLVFLQGIMGDGDLDWHTVLPHLSGRFTCHLPSLRGRGLSGDHPDLSIGRLVEDVLAYVDSIEPPAGLVGWSAGAGLALCAAARSDAVDAVVAVELGTPSHMAEGELVAFRGAIARMRELSSQGALTDAVRVLADALFNHQDVVAAEQAGYFEATGRYVPTMLDFFDQQSRYGGPTPDDQTVLGAISVPVLILLGTHTAPYAAATALHVAHHVRNARIQQVAGAGHALPLTHPEALAGALNEFFSTAQPPTVRSPRP